MQKIGANTHTNKKFKSYLKDEENKSQILIVYNSSHFPQQIDI